MTTIEITRKKQVIGSLGTISVLSCEGHSVKLKAGEKAILTTSQPEKLEIKRFLRKVTLFTGLPSGATDKNVALELFYNLSGSAIATLFITAAISLAIAVSKLFQPTWYYAPSIVPALVVIIIAGIIRRSLSIRKLPS